MKKKYNTPHRCHVVKTRMTEEELAKFKHPTHQISFHGKFISCSLTETSGQKLLPKNMLQTDPVAPRTPIWMEVAAGLTMTARA